MFKLDKNEMQLNAFDKQKLVFNTPIKLERENAGRCKLQKGNTYVIIPSLEKAGHTGEFFLSVYFDQPLRNVNCKRIFHPLDKNNGKEEVYPYLIPEEAERMQSRAPMWKIELIKESL